MYSQMRAVLRTRLQLCDGQQGFALRVAVLATCASRFRISSSGLVETYTIGASTQHIHENPNNTRYLGFYILFACLRFIFNRLRTPESSALVIKAALQLETPINSTQRHLQSQKMAPFPYPASESSDSEDFGKDIPKPSTPKKSALAKKPATPKTPTPKKRVTFKVEEGSDEETKPKLTPFSPQKKKNNRLTFHDISKSTVLKGANAARSSPIIADQVRSILLF